MLKQRLVTVERKIYKFVNNWGYYPEYSTNKLGNEKYAREVPWHGW